MATAIPKTWHGIPTDCESSEYLERRAGRALEGYELCGKKPPEPWCDPLIRHDVFRYSTAAERWELLHQLESQAVADGAMSHEQMKRVHLDFERRANASLRAFRAALFGRDFHQLPREDALMMPCRACGAEPGRQCHEGCTLPQE